MAVPGAWGLRAGPGLPLVTLFISSSLLSFSTPSPTGPVLGDPLPSCSGGEGKVTGLGPLHTVTEAEGYPMVLATPWTITLQALLSLGFPSQNTGVDCQFLLHGIFPTQGSTEKLPDLSPGVGLKVEKAASKDPFLL